MFFLNWHSVYDEKQTFLGLSGVFARVQGKAFGKRLLGLASRQGFTFRFTARQSRKFLF